MEEKKILPEKYYHSYYHDLLLHVKHKYTPLLSHSEKCFITDFNRLSVDCQCLYLRLQNRKGQYFRFSKFHYPEINNINHCLQKLIKKGFCTVVGNEIEEDIIEVFNLYNRAELIALAQYFGISTYGFSKLNKLGLLNYLLTKIPFEDLLTCFQNEPIIRQGFVEEALMIQ
ncbi:MAG: hypothetical protein AAGI07_10670, partial [Bacteroidota bacterium]